MLIYAVHVVRETPWMNALTWEGSCYFPPWSGTADVHVPETHLHQLVVLTAHTGERQEVTPITDF